MNKSAGPRKQVPSARRPKAEHVIVDGSNLATEGRARPSLAQLNEAVLAFMEEHPKTVVTVIVDATFGHRIDPKEVGAFDKAVEHNELVTPPAGTVGRGDAFVLNIAEKVGAAILSNDSYQEFHGQYPWLFDDGRLIGGKPVPNIGWVFVERVPVRGDKSRRAVRDAKQAGDGDAEERPAKRTRAKISAAAMKPMPVPKTPPPGATLRARAKNANTSTRPNKTEDIVATPAAASDGSRTVNDILPFLHFVERNPVGSQVTGKVESYSSHGAYVTLGDVRGYVPLRLLGSPPPRSARDVMKLGDELIFEVVEIIAGRRSINVRLADTKSPVKKAAEKGSIAKKSTAKKSAEKSSTAKKALEKSPTAKKSAEKTATAKKAAGKKTATKSASKSTAKTTVKTTVKKVAAKTTAKKSTAKPNPAKKTVAKAKSLTTGRVAAGRTRAVPATSVRAEKSTTAR